MDRLRELLHLAPHLSEIFRRNDIMMAITDETQYLYYSKSRTMDARVTDGMPFFNHDLFGTMRQTNAPASQIAPPEYGTAFIAVGSPIFNEHYELIGGIGFGLRITTPDDVVESVIQFSQHIANPNGPSPEITGMHQFLNHVCSMCGGYGQANCAVCPVEIRRQEEVLYTARAILLHSNTAITGLKPGYSRAVSR